MRKIILTTFFRAENYGAALQTYALQSVLQDKDFFVEILNFRDPIIEEPYELINLKRSSFYFFLRACVSTLIFYKRNKKRHKKFVQFRNAYLHIGKEEYRDIESIKKNPPKADIYLTGSDQVWNTEITKGVSEVYTLNFGDKQIKRVSYAASIGNSRICTDDEEVFRRRLLRIDALSVREETAKRFLEKLLSKKNITVTLDPVLLRSREEWETILPKYERSAGKYILAYRVEMNEEYQKIVNDLSKKTGLRVVHFEKRKVYGNNFYSAYTAGPLEFVNLIKHAEYIVTTSFHGTAFSVIFHKKFWVVPHQYTGSRVTDLLEVLKISERVVYTCDEYLSKNYEQMIDYEKVDAILSSEREKSLKWLDRALESKHSK